MFQCSEGSPILFKDHAAQCFQLGDPLRSWGGNRDVLIEAARNLDQEIGKPPRP